MLRRLHIESNDIGGLLFEVGIIACHVTIQPVRLDPSLSPDTLHSGFAQPERCRHLPASPVSAAIIRSLCGLAQSALYGRCRRTRLTAFVARLQTGDALLFETSLPARYRWPRRLQLYFDLAPRFALGQGQQQSGAKDVAGWKCSRLRTAEELLTLLFGYFRHSMKASHIQFDDAAAIWLRNEGQTTRIVASPTPAPAAGSSVGPTAASRTARPCRSCPERRTTGGSSG